MDLDRRAFLQQSLHAAVSAGLVGLWPATVLSARVQAIRPAESSPVGPLRPVTDPASGLDLISLPDGFTCTSLSWTGDEMADGQPTPPRHDGMAVIPQSSRTGTDPEGRWVIVRNHEVVDDAGSFAPPDITYDPAGSGGTTTLRVDPENGAVSVRPSLGGTLMNCAGGPTPWGTWLSSEERALGPGDSMGWGGSARPTRLERTHGWVFEVPPDGSDAQPIHDMGRMLHEACAVGPGGEIYQTEDAEVCGFYRFLPMEPGRPVAGGRLQMLRAPDRRDLTTDVPVGRPLPVEWVDIEEPGRLHSPGRRDDAGVVAQGLRQGAARFRRLEGCWAGPDGIHFTSTDGGRARSGQVWRFDPAMQELTLVFESPGVRTLDNPDNLTVSPGGGLIICEDGGGASYIRAVARDGRLFDFARNEVRLRGERNGNEGDFRASEWAGACFSPDGRWLFVNIQTPGITLAITGPWAEAGL